MQGSDYGNAGSMSSSGDKDEYKSGSLDHQQKRNPYKKDMYDSMVDLRNHKSMTKAHSQLASVAGKTTSATTTPNNGIQGSTATKSDGMTGNKSTAISVPGNSGDKDYGKGNPYSDKSDGKGGAKGPTSGKPVGTKQQIAQPGKKPKHTVKSIAELRELASKL